EVGGRRRLQREGQVLVRREDRELAVHVEAQQRGERDQERGGGEQRRPDQPRPIGIHPLPGVHRRASSASRAPSAAVPRAAAVEAPSPGGAAEGTAASRRASTSRHSAWGTGPDSTSAPVTAPAAPASPART